LTVRKTGVLEPATDDLQWKNETGAEIQVKKRTRTRRPVAAVETQHRTEQQGNTKNRAGKENPTRARVVNSGTRTQHWRQKPDSHQNQPKNKTDRREKSAEQENLV
jgi:hypothetical protein